KISVPQYIQWGRTKWRLGIFPRNLKPRSYQRGDAKTASPPLGQNSTFGSEVDGKAFVHWGIDIPEGWRLHHLELSLEDPGGILVLVGPLEPDRHRHPLEFFEIFDRQAIELRAGLLEFAPRFHVGFL